jgi:hypothetical protein
MSDESLAAEMGNFADLADHDILRLIGVSEH